ncbi:hypothetical protein A2U01_0107591, partial [Trifolium medium]|nr:hypothetical protein [Trifolium medium]
SLKQPKYSSEGYKDVPRSEEDDLVAGNEERDC